MSDRWLIGDPYTNCDDCVKKERCTGKEEFRPRFLSAVADGKRLPVCKGYKQEQYRKAVKDGKYELVKI